MLSLYCRPLRRLPAAAAARAASQQPAAEEPFLPLDLGRRREEVRRARQRRQTTAAPPRHERQSPTQRWGDVWPAPRTFQPASVPLPLRQGFVERPAVHAPPGKEANAELMKIANFLHLTPPAVERHCLALRRFCTPWPAALTEEKLDRLRPLEVVTQDFVHAAPTLRHPDARIVAVKLPLAALQLTKTDRDKLLRLVGERYDPATDVLTIVADRCPLRRQNLDYALYLLTALYYESCKREPWEALRTDADAEELVWEGSTSQAAVRRLGADEGGEVVARYAAAVTQLHNVGEDEEAVAAYRRAVVALLGLPEHVGDA